MEKYLQLGQIVLDFKWGFLDASLYIVTSVLDKEGSHTLTMCEVPFFAKTYKSNVDAKWRIMDVSQSEAPTWAHYLGTHSYQVGRRFAEYINCY